MFNKLLVLGVLVAIVLGGVALAKDKTVVVENPEQLGAVMPYYPIPELNLGGLRLVGLEKALATGSSTVCAIQSPSATSTLVSAGVKFTLASTSAVTVDLSKGTTQYATSTLIGTTYSVAASAQATIVASSTGSVAGDGTIFAPSQWFVARINEFSAASGAPNASTGRCWANWVAPQ